MIYPQIYTSERRGATTRLFVPKAGAAAAPGGMPIQNDVTVAGSKVAAKSNARKFLEFQNKSLVQDMILSFGIPASADVGDLIGPLGSIRYEIEVPSEEVNVFCAVAGEKFSLQERLA